MVGQCQNALESPKRTSKEIWIQNISKFRKKDCFSFQVGYTAGYLCQAALIQPMGDTIIQKAIEKSGLAGANSKYRSG